jgi:hypothetical protein
MQVVVTLEYPLNALMIMSEKPTDEELERRIKKLEKVNLERKETKRAFRIH